MTKDADKKTYLLTYSNEHLIDFIEKILYLVNVHLIWNNKYMKVAELTLKMKGQLV